MGIGVIREIEVIVRQTFALRLGGVCFIMQIVKKSQRLLVYIFSVANP